MTAIRVEHASLGPVSVSGDKLWGAQTQGSGNGDTQDIQAEPADEVDRAGITAVRDRTSLQPARQLILGVMCWRHNEKFRVLARPPLL